MYGSEGALPVDSHSGEEAAAAVEAVSPPTTVLFVRQGSGDFVCMGRCAVSCDDEGAGGGSDGDNDGRRLVKLMLELADFERLGDAASVVVGSGPGAQASGAQAGTTARRAAAGPGDRPGDGRSTREARDGGAGVAADEGGGAQGGAGAGASAGAEEWPVAFEKGSVGFQEEIAAMVLQGDVVGAMLKSCEESGTKAGKRSLTTGLGELKRVLAGSDEPGVLRAVAELDDVAERLGLY